MADDSLDASKLAGADSELQEFFVAEKQKAQFQAQVKFFS